MASVHSLLLFRSTCLQLISALLLWVLLVERVEMQNRSHEVRTLLKFKEVNLLSVNGTYGSTGYWIGWNENDENPCAWAGVTCTDNYTVWELDLSGWNLGPFGGFNGQQFTFFNVEVLSNLTDLRHLDLSSNGLWTIPEDIGNLTGLTLLDMSSNNLLFGGIPPSISACRSLRSLSLQGSLLSGEIPSLRDLVSLQFLNLSHNFFSGPFPTELEDLSSLVALDLSNNSLNGTIPALPNLNNLVDLMLDNNDFTAFEEPWVLGANLTLQQLSVSFNKLEGRIPSSITNLSSLRVLYMSNNRLSGDTPFGFSRPLENPYFTLDFSQNQLTGEIPGDLLQQPSNVQHSGELCPSFNLSHNLLSGGIPIDGASYVCFFTLDLSYNNLSGPVPFNIFGNIGISSWILRLQNNYFSGDIVDVLLGSPGLNETVELLLQNNLLTGDLSRIVSSGAVHNLQVLDLSNNELRCSTSKANPDPIQTTLEALTSSVYLQEFRAGGNNFSGTSLPTSCFVQQSYAATFFGLHMQVLDLSNAQLQGEILGEVFNSSCLPFLEFLNLSNNRITGPLPQSVANIPRLATFDVSNNHLSGPLPTFPFNSSLNNANFFKGNVGLCGYPLQLCSSRRSGVQSWVLLVIIGASSTIAIGSCLAATWQWRVYSKRHQQDADLIRTLMERDAAIVMSLRELRKVTNNFAKTAQIGEGGFGIVYAGKLNNGTTVAVKRSKRESSEENKEQFLNEVRILSQVNHRNLVKLLGCCMENKTAALVLEFVSNGTLQDHLEGKVEAIPLSWHQRLKIGVQIADALNYLHSATTTPIYHRDVKSANILLDDDLNAKVTDFGISKLDPMRGTHVSTIGMGTLGYIDPEYWASFQLTDKSDVYSFGVVLLELLSGQPAIDFRRFEEEKSLVVFANPHIKSGDMGGLIDPSLMDTFNDPMGYGRDSMLNVGQLAMKCVNMRSRARPTMNEVLKELQSLWLELSGPSIHLGCINEDDNEDIIPLSNSFSCDSISFTEQNDAGGVQMSQFSRSSSFR